MCMCKTMATERERERGSREGEVRERGETETGDRGQGVIYTY